MASPEKENEKVWVMGHLYLPQVSCTIHHLHGSERKGDENSVHNINVKKELYGFKPSLKREWCQVVVTHL